tara:strand:+ start:7034 stop:7678 length:645 start_codon:yes stop_codon:yes gene_type:complete
VLQHNVVAVYGTLKKGGSNHHLLYGQRFVGKGTTRDKYPLVISGLPYLLDKSGYGHHVEVEVYKVNNDTFAALDSLEGHPQFYQRKRIPIKLGSGTILTAWIYFINKDTSYRSMGSMKYHKSFPIRKPIIRQRFTMPKYSKPNYQRYTYEPNTRYHQQQSLFSSLSLIHDKEDDNTKYCNVCLEEVTFDPTEISNKNYHCSVCNEMYSEQEVTS